MKSSSSGNAAASLKSGWIHLVCRYSPREALWTHAEPTLHYISVDSEGKEEDKDGEREQECETEKVK